MCSSRLRAAPSGGRQCEVLKVIKPQDHGKKTRQPPCVPRKNPSYLADRWSSARYRGGKISPEDILYIPSLIEQHPQESRPPHYRPSSC